MGEIKVTYNGNMATAASCGGSPIVLKTDGSAESHASGTAYTPVDMFVTSLGACMLSMMGMTLGNRGIAIDGATASMTYTSDEATHRVTAITVTFRFPGMSLSEAEKKMLSAAARACPVGASINPDIKKDIVFEF